MFDKILSTTLMILGAAIVAISVLADAIGIGAVPNVVGWKQYSGAVIGLVIVFFGAHLALHHVLRK